MNTDERTDKEGKGWMMWIYLSPVYVGIAAVLFWRSFSGGSATSTGEVKPMVSTMTITFAKEGPEPPAEGQPAPAVEGPAAAGSEQNGEAPVRTFNPDSPWQKVKRKIMSKVGVVLPDLIALGMKHPEALDNPLVVKAFMSRPEMKEIMRSPAALKQFMIESQAVKMTLDDPDIQTAMRDRDAMIAILNTKFAKEVLTSPEPKALLQNPLETMDILMANPQLMNVLSNQDVMAALASSPETRKMASEVASQVTNGLSNVMKDTTK